MAKMNAPRPPAAAKADPGGRKAEGKLAGIFKRNPATALGVGGAGVVVVLALMMRGRGGASDPATSSDQLQGFRGAYDSSATDLYNQFADMVKGLQDQIADLQKPPPSSTPPPTPAPAPKPTPKPGGTVKKPTSSTHYYTIKRGDTLSSIASRAHVSMSTIRALNPVFWSNPKYHSGNMIWSGGHVKLPGK